MKRILLSLLVLTGVSITAMANNVTNWPATGWAPLYGQSSLYSDIPNDTGNNGHEYLDFVGDTNYAAAFMYYRPAAASGEAEDQLLFRVRLDDDKNKMTGAFQIFFETSYDSSVDWVLQVDSTDLDSSGLIEFGSASGTNRSGVTFGTVVWSNNYVGSVGYANWAGTPTGDGSSFNSDDDYFFEFGMPWSVFTNFTGVTSTNDPFRLLLTSSQSGGQIDDGDVGNSSAGLGVDVVFDDIYADPDPATGPFTQTLTFTDPGTQDVTNSVNLSGVASSGLPVVFSILSGPGSIASQSNLTFSAAGTTVIIASQPGNSNWLPAPPVTNSFSVLGVSATVTLGNLNPTYDGTAQTATATTAPSGLTVDFTYNGSLVAPTNAGVYTVIGTINDPSYQGAATNTFTIAKGSQTLTFPNPGSQITTNSVNLSATASSGLTVSDFTVISGPASVSGSTLSFSDSGTVLVVANQIGDVNWAAAAPVTNSLSVSKATASINVTGLTPTYTGGPQTVGVTTDPNGQPVGITYNGSLVAPTNAGVYTVIVTVNDPLYQGVTTNTFTIGKADQAIAFTNPGPQTVSDTVNLLATADSGLTVLFGVVSGPAELSGSTLTFTNTGAVVISADQAGDSNWNAALSTNVSFNVGKAAAVVTLADLTATFDGSAQTASATTAPPGLTVDITYNGSTVAPTNAGTYTVIGTINDLSYQGTASNTFTIGKADQNIDFTNPGPKTVSDTVNLLATADSGLSILFGVVSGPAELSGSTLTFTNSGTVVVSADQAGDSNWNAALSTNVSFSVGKASAVVTLADLTATYDGSAQTASATTAPLGLTVDITYNGSSVAPTNAGVYTVIGTINDVAYQGVASNTFTIAKGAQTLTFPNPGSQVTTNSVVLSATASSGLTVSDFTVISGPASLSGSTLSFSGSGTVLVAANHSGDSNWNAAASVTNSLNVSKVTGSMNVTGLTPTYTGGPQTVSVSTTPSGQSVITTYNGSPVAPTNAGVYSVIVTINDPLYQGVTTNTFTIGKADQNIDFTNPGPKAVSDTVNLVATADSALTVLFGVVSGPAELSGSTLTFTNSGTVVISADQAGDANWNAALSTNVSFSVGKASAVVTLADLSATYDGSAQTASATTAPLGLTVDITYNGSSVAPTNAGTYTVIGTINDVAYQGVASNTFTIAKGAQTLTFPNPGSQVTTNSVDLSATASSGLTVSDFTVISGPASLSGSTLSFSGSGTVLVAANHSGDSNWNAAASVTNSLNVSKVTGSMNVTGLTPIYTGGPQTVTVTTTPSGQPVGITYNGSTVAPTNAGVYSVIVTINDPLYQGVTTNTFTIGKADQAIDFTNPGPTTVTNTVNLVATSDSGLSILFGVVSGPAELSGSTLTFTNSGTVVVSADQAGDANWNAALSTNVSFSVASVNDAPVANDDVTSTDEDTSVTIDVLGNDSDPDGDPLSLLGAATSNGLAVVSGTNVVYTPSTNYFGTNVVYYFVTDGSLTTTGLAAVVVNPINDVPTASPDSAATNEDTPVTIDVLGNDDDPEGDSLSLLGASSTNGSAVVSGTNVVYTPSTNFFGTNTLFYYVSDGSATSTGSVTVVVTGINDEPVAVADSAATFENTSVDISVLVNDTDEDGDSLSLISASTTNGSASVSGTNVVYTPPSGFVGTAFVSYLVSDGFATSTGQVSIAVTQSADLTMMLTGPTNGVVGLPMTFTLTVANAGPSVASNVVMQKSVPTNLVSSLISHAGFRTNDVVNWPAIASLASGASTNFTITVTASNPGSYNSSASAASSTPDPDSANNDSSSVLSQLSLLVVAAEYGISEVPATLNHQTGLFEQRITVTNTMVVAVPAFRIMVDGLRAGVTLYNASASTNGVPYVQVNTPLNAGAVTDVILEYHVPDRQAFTNTLSVIWMLTEDINVVAGAGAVVNTAFMDTRDSAAHRFLIEFETIPGRTYTVLYADDLSGDWYTATPPISAGSTRTQWYDDGQPKTHSHPSSVPSRFYRVILSK